MGNAESYPLKDTTPKKKKPNHGILQAGGMSRSYSKPAPSGTFLNEFEEQIRKWSLTIKKLKDNQDEIGEEHMLQTLYTEMKNASSYLLKSVSLNDGCVTLFIFLIIKFLIA